MIKPPPFGRGQRIGLFGGSFNPAHYGHYMVALYALKRLRLDWVWWLVSPQNPLKDSHETASYGERLAQAARIASHPRFKVTGLEGQIGSRNTAQTLEALHPLLDEARFVWIMGADSFAGLHRWHDWTVIPETLPLAFLARPRLLDPGTASHAAIRFAEDRIPTAEAARLPDMRPPAWVFLPMPLRPESSTAIRALNHNSTGRKQGPDQQETIR